VKEGDEIERNRAENGIRAQSVSNNSRPCLSYSPSAIKLFLSRRSEEGIADFILIFTEV
jgi:hypothetical protein